MQMPLPASASLLASMQMPAALPALLTLLLPASTQMHQWPVAKQVRFPRWCHRRTQF
jgi:hypothetical protein